MPPLGERLAAESSLFHSDDSTQALVCEAAKADLAGSHFDFVTGYLVSLLSGGDGERMEEVVALEHKDLDDWVEGEVDGLVGGSCS